MNESLRELLAGGPGKKSRSKPVSQCRCGLGLRLRGLRRGIAMSKWSDFEAQLDTNQGVKVAPLSFATTSSSAGIFSYYDGWPFATHATAPKSSAQ